MTYPYLIAEAGVAHFGSIRSAMSLLEASIAANADCFKIQVFHPDSLFANDASGWCSRLKSRTLSYTEIREIHDKCLAHGIDFLLTLHDSSHFDLYESLHLKTIKLGSGEAGNIPFITDCLTRCEHLIFSTGLSTVADIQAVYDLAIAKGVRLTLLHCNTAYPTPPSDVNLSRITSLSSLFPMASIGYSDHTPNHDACIGAVFLGASMIERHITLEKDIPDAQDWKVSSLPHELIELRSRLNSASLLRGNTEIAISPSASQNRYWALKSPYINTIGSQGQLLSSTMLTMKRPYNGTTYLDIQPFIGNKPLAVNLQPNDPITISSFM